MNNTKIEASEFNCLGLFEMSKHKHYIIFLYKGGTLSCFLYAPRYIYLGVLKTLRERRCPVAHLSPTVDE